MVLLTSDYIHSLDCYLIGHCLTEINKQFSSMSIELRHRLGMIRKSTPKNFFAPFCYENICLSKHSSFVRDHRLHLIAIKS